MKRTKHSNLCKQVYPQCLCMSCKRDRLMHCVSYANNNGCYVAKCDAYKKETKRGIIMNVTKVRKKIAVFILLAVFSVFFILLVCAAVVK